MTQARPVANAAPSMPHPNPATKAQSSRMFITAFAIVTASPSPGRSAVISREWNAMLSIWKGMKTDSTRP